VIQKLIEDGWLVVALDLPGHGNSGGERHNIGNFSEYGAALRLVVNSLDEAPKPLVLVGQSLGAAAVLSSLEGIEVRPEALVLIAPLLRIHAHGWASLGAALVGPFTKTLPGRIPKRWFHAYRDWVRSDQSPALNAALGRGTRVGFVLYGDDKAISNTAVLKLAERAPGSTSVILDGLGHWEIDKKEPDPRLWESVLAVLDGGVKEFR
jgi:pimeloyl-ACP methyl ester carboxylesterase